MSYREEVLRPPAPIEVAIGVRSESQFYADLTGTIVGVFASTFEVYPKGTPVEVIVTFPTGVWFKAWGAVQFVRTASHDQLPGLGVEFTTIEARDHEAAAAFCEEFRPPMLHDEG